MKESTTMKLVFENVKPTSGSEPEEIALVTGSPIALAFVVPSLGADQTLTAQFAAAEGATLVIEED
jgi:hypothetical protein